MSVRAVKEEAPSPLGVHLYLVAYNAACCVLWSICLFQTTALLINGHAITDFLEPLRKVLFLAQNLALLEVVHSLTGLVRSHWFTVALQVTSRLAILWCVVYLAPNSTEQLAFVVMVLAWCAIEVPRYFFYIVSLLFPDSIPFALTWIRYSLFILLYPAGIYGEVCCLLAALPLLAKARPLSLDMPNPYNFAFDFYSVLWYSALLYVPGSPFLYLHMLKLRNKKLGEPSDEATKKKKK